MSKFVIGCNSDKKLRLNEAVSTKEEYILEGIFADLNGEENRNGRIYTAEEYLPHLEYLRNDIKKGEPLLGELDHPADRFEISLQNVSHQIIDLWFDQSKNQVLGKIKLLDTPSGKIAKALVEDGVPLHISSRAAGTVDPQTHKVKIQQMFTFDLVATPGFSQAILHRVNESANAKNYSEDTMKFLRSSEKNNSLNQAMQLGFVNENISLHEVYADVKIRPEAQNLQINNKINFDEMSHRLNEEDAKPLVASDNAAAQMGIPEADMSLDGSGSSDNNVNMDLSQNDDNSSNNADKSQEKSDDKLILSVKAEYDEAKDDNMILSVKGDYDAKDEDVEDDKSQESDENNEDETSESTEDKQEVKATDTNKLNDELKEDKEKLEKTRKDVLGKVDSLLGNIKKKNEAKESVVSEYPFSAKLTESNFAQFNNLNYEQKTKVANYVNENCIVNSDILNRTWDSPLKTNVEDEPIWLKNASDEYRNLYENASEIEKQNLANTASYLIFESQYDINTFWENSRLKDKAEQNRLNEQYINSVPKVYNTQKSELPYSTEFIQNITSYIENLNK